MNIAVTGGIAAGKSTFARELNALHRFVHFDADSCVRDLLTSNEQAKEEICTVFGEDTICKDGSIDRRRLRDRAFASTESRQKLETILHPRVRAEWIRLRNICTASGSHFLAEIPLLFEVSAENYFEATILVATSPQIQHARLAQRGISAETAAAILSRQLPVMEKIQRATVVVWNDGSESALAQQAKLLFQRLNIQTQ